MLAAVRVKIRTRTDVKTAATTVKNALILGVNANHVII
jgi:hypothetical protein